MKDERESREIVHRIDLKNPVKRGEEETIKVLEFRRAKGKDVKHLLNDRSDNAFIRMAVRLTGQPTDVFDEMDAGDFWEVVDYLGKLLPGGPETGDNASV